MDELITVIITTYKRPVSYIKKAVESALSQTYKSVEVIVVDDNAKDYSERKAIEEYMQSMKGQVLYIQHEANRGACAARNTGLSRASGDYVAFLDDDDQWVPQKLEKQIALFKNDRIGFVYCGYKIINLSDGTETVFSTKKYRRGKIFDSLIIENFVGSTSGPLIRKSLLQQIGGFDEQQRASQDYDVWLRLSNISLADYVEEPLLLYYIHSGEQISKNDHNNIAGTERLIEKNKEYLENNPIAWNAKYIGLCGDYAEIGQKKKAVSLLKKSIARAPFQIKRNLKAIIFLATINNRG